jgi:hypothetical protein
VHGEIRQAQQAPAHRQVGELEGGERGGGVHGGCLGPSGLKHNRKTPRAYATILLNISHYSTYAGCKCLFSALPLLTYVSCMLRCGSRKAAIFADPKRILGYVH